MRATLLISSSLAAMACGAAEDQSPNDSEMTTTLEHSIRVEPEILNEFTTREEEIQFIRMGDESPTYLMSFARPTSIGEGLLEALMREHPKLTLLETFHALAPEGETPHPDLEAFHLTQTEIFNRADAEVRRVNFDVNRPVEKFTAQECTNQIIANTPPGEVWHSDRLNAVSMPNGGDLGLLCPAWQGQAGCNHQSLVGTHIVITCNDGPSDIAAWYAYQRNNDPWMESALHFITVPNQFRGWLLPEHKTGLFNDWQVLGILNEDIHFPGETPPSYFARAGFSD